MEQYAASWLPHCTPAAAGSACLLYKCLLKQNAGMAHCCLDMLPQANLIKTGHWLQAAWQSTYAVTQRATYEPHYSSLFLSTTLTMMMNMTSMMWMIVTTRLNMADSFVPSVNMIVSSNTHPKANLRQYQQHRCMLVYDSNVWILHVHLFLHNLHARMVCE